MKGKSSWEKKKVHGKRKILVAKKKQVTAIEKSSWQKRNSRGKGKMAWQKKKKKKKRLWQKKIVLRMGKIRILTLSDVIKLNSKQKKYKKECIYDKYFIGFENL